MTEQKTVSISMFDIPADAPVGWRGDEMDFESVNGTSIEGEQIPPLVVEEKTVIGSYHLVGSTLDVDVSDTVYHFEIPSHWRKVAVTAETPPRITNGIEFVDAEQVDA